MDADELARIEATLLAAIAAAKVVVKRLGVGPELRELVRHLREMHDLLVEAMIANKAPSTEYYHRGLSESAENAIEHLEALAMMPDGKMQ